MLLAAVLWLAVPAWSLAQDTDLSPGQDARGTDHTGHDHAGQPLTGVDLSPDLDPTMGGPSLLVMADFDAANLGSANLTGVDATSLSGANLVLDGAELSGGTWTNATLPGADLSFATGTGPDFTGVDLTGATLDDAHIVAATFVGADLTDLVGRSALLIGADMTGAILVNANLASGALVGAWLIDADLSDANLAAADLTRVDARCGDSVADPVVDPPALDTCPKFDGADLSVAFLTDGFFQYGRFVDSTGASGGPVDLSDADLIRADFSDACFTTLVGGACDATAQVPPADLSDAAVSGIRLDRAVARGVLLSGAVGGCVPARGGDSDQSERCPSIVGADLRDADLSQARIFAAVATEALLHGADLSGTVLDGLQTPCTLPVIQAEAPKCLELFDASGMSPASPATVLGIGLRDADVAGVAFDSLDLTGANLGGVNAYALRPSVDDMGQSFDVAYVTTFRGATLVDAVFTSADLEQADFTGADLTRADLSDSILTDTVFDTVVARDALFNRALLTCADPNACTTFQSVAAMGLSGARFVGTDLTGQDLSGLDLTDVDFSGAGLTNVDLSSATLVGVDFTSTVMSVVDITTNLDFTNTTFDSTDLRCADPGACDRFAMATDLVNASFVGANLTSLLFGGKNLDLADFTGADLTDADFTNSGLTGADFASATLTGVVWTGARLDGTRFDFTDLSCADPVGCEPFAGIANGAAPGDDGLTAASFRSANLTNVTFSASPDTLELMNADFSSSNLTNVSFQNVDARKARFDFVSAICSASDACADFSGAILTDGGMLGASFVRSELAKVSFVGHDLRVVDFTGSTLSEADFTGADLTDADLSDTILDDARLDGADLTSTRLDRASLLATSFAGATFAKNGTTQATPAGTGCTPGAGESPVELKGAALEGAAFAAAINFYEGCIVVDATTTYDGGTTTFPPGFTLRAQMTNVPEPATGLAQLAAAATVAALARRQRTRRGARA